MKNKSKKIKILLLTVLSLIICTILATNIYHYLMPKVVTGSFLQNEKLEYNMNFIAEIPKNVAIANNEQYKIIEQLVKIGDVVDKGTPLLRIDVGDWYSEILNAEANILRQKNNLAATDWTAGDRTVYEKELHSSEQAYKTLLKKYPSGGIVRSPYKGTVSNLAAVGVTNMQQPLYEILQNTTENDEDIAVIQWNLTLEQAKILGESDVKIEANYSVQIDNSFNFEQVKTSVILKECKYNEENEMYIATAEIQNQFLPTKNTIINIDVVASTVPFALAVPVSAIKNTANNEDVIYLLQDVKGIWGTNTIAVQQKVNVLKSNGVFAVIDSQIPYEICSKKNILVVGANDFLIDGDKVNVVETLN